MTIIDIYLTNMAIIDIIRYLYPLRLKTMHIIADATKNILQDTTISEEQKTQALNTIHDLVKELKAKAPSEKEMSAAHSIYEKLGYVPGAFVRFKSKPDIIGVITQYNTSTGFYDGKRYPIIVQFPFGTFEYSILTTHYHGVEKYKDNPKKVLAELKDDINIIVVDDLDQKTAEKVLATETLLDKMAPDELVDYFNSESFDKEKLPYIKEHVIVTIEFQHKKEVREMIAKMCQEIRAMNLDDLVKYFESEKFAKDREEDDIREFTYYELDKRFETMSGETLLKYYDNKGYGEETKKIMRKIIETK